MKIGGYLTAPGKQIRTNLSQVDMNMTFISCFESRPADVGLRRDANLIFIEVEVVLKPGTLM